MSPTELQIARKLTEIFLDLFPLPTTARKLVDLPIAYMFDKGEARRRKTVSSIAARIASDLTRVPDQDNPGSAASASLDIIDILRLSSLGPDKLVELDLDTDRVFSSLLQSAGPFLASASSLRQGLIRSGLREVACTVVECAPELPGVQIAFMRAMLRSRRGGAL